MPLQSKSRSHTAELVGTGTIEYDFLIGDGRQQGIQILEGDRGRSGNAALLPFDLQSSPDSTLDTVAYTSPDQARAEELGLFANRSNSHISS